MKRPSRLRVRKIVSLITFFAIVVLSAMSTQVADALISASQHGKSSSSNSFVEFHQQAGSTNGLLAWYRFDGDASDSSASGRTGSFINSGTFTAGKFGSAYNLNGSSQYVTATDASLPSGSSARTFSAWIYPTASSINSNVIMAYGSQTNEPASGISVYNSSGSTYARFCGWGDDYSVATALTLNRWTLITATFDGTTATVYYNGVSVGTSNRSSWSTVLGGTLYVGRNLAASGYFQGAIDDARIYNRVLSTTEITQLFQGSLPPPCDQTCLQYWKLDDTTGTTAANAVAGGATGTLTNMTFDAASVSGVYGGSLLFNGTNNYISMGNIDNFSGTTAFSAFAWVYFTSIPSQAGVVGKYNNHGGGQWVLHVFNGNVQLHREVSPYEITGSTTLTANRWYYIGGTYDGAKMHVYVDGKEDATALTIGSIPSSSSTFYIGSYVDASNVVDYFFPGQIDEVRVYNRAISASEVEALYEAGKS